MPLARAARRALAALPLVTLPLAAQAWSPDAGPGRYRNPVLFADYSDPDVVRVGDDFWMTASSFNAVPGLPILHSRDLVHWRIVNHALPRLPADFDAPSHGNGVWAPSIRYHAGEYYIYYGDPDRGIYVVKARDPRGAWSAPLLVKAAKGWIDPAPLWDDDGRAYLVHAFARSRSGIKHVLDVVRMSSDGTRLLDEGTRVFEDSLRHPTAEGPKMYERDGWYWIFAPAGGVATGWQLAMRARSPLGPYEARTVMAQGSTPINGPHQGAWVKTPGGESWFVHFQDRGAYGRVVLLEPMTWTNGWPVIGADPDGDGTGEPVLEHRVPDVRARASREVPQTSDEFASGRPGLQWQWHANPRPEWYSSGTAMLRLRAQPLPGVNLWSAPNLLLQKLPAPAFTATTRLVAHPAATGETFGLLVMGLDYAYVAVRRAAGGGDEIVQASATNADRGTPELLAPPVPVPAGRPVYLRVDVSADSARCRFSWSTDGERFAAVGAPFTAREGRWIGAKVGLFATGATDAATAGHADVRWFRVRPPRSLPASASARGPRVDRKAAAP